MNTTPSLCLGDRHFLVAYHIFANTFIWMLCFRYFRRNLLKSRTLGILSLLIIVLVIAFAAYLTTNAKPAGSSTWQTAQEISNTGKQDTTEFSVNNPWRIIWKMDNYTSTLFLVAVYEKVSTGYSVVAEADYTDSNSTTGILPVRYTGSFVIRVATMDDTKWTLWIQEFTATT
jgi:hypothetical protein